MSPKVKLNFIRLSDVEPETFHDGDYRRGYHHGYLSAIEDIERGFKLKELIAHFNGPLDQWRFRDDLRQMTEPPALKRGSKRRKDGAQ